MIGVECGFQGAWLRDCTPCRCAGIIVGNCAQPQNSCNRLQDLLVVPLQSVRAITSAARPGAALGGICERVLLLHCQVEQQLGMLFRFAIRGLIPCV